MRNNLNLYLYFISFIFKIRSYKCEICDDYGATTLAGLTAHMALVHKEGKYKVFVYLLYLRYLFICIRYLFFIFKVVFILQALSYRATCLDPLHPSLKVGPFSFFSKKFAMFWNLCKNNFQFFFTFFVWQNFNSKFLGLWDFSEPISWMLTSDFR